MSHAYAYGFELERSNRHASTSSVITTISTLAHYAALSPPPQAETHETSNSPSHPSASRKYRGIKGSFRKRKEKYQKAQKHHEEDERGRQDRKPPPAEKTKKKQKKKGGPFSFSSPLAAAADGRRKNSAAREEDEDAPAFVQQHFPDAPLMPGSRHVPSEEECEELFMSASLHYCSSVSSVSSLSSAFSVHAHGDHQGNHNNNSSSRSATDGANRKTLARNKDAKWIRLQSPSPVSQVTTTNTNNNMMEDDGERQGSAWAASAAAAMSGIDFGEINWGRQQSWEQIDQNWSRARSQTTATPPPPHVREDQEMLMRRKPGSVDSPTTHTRRTNNQRRNYPRRQQTRHPRKSSDGHGFWSKKMSAVSSKPGSILIGLDDPGRMNTGLGTNTRPYGSVGSNCSYTSAVEEEIGNTTGMAALEAYPDSDLPMLMPAVYQPEPGSLLGMGTFAPTSVPVRLPSHRRRSRQAQDSEKRPDTRLSAGQAIRQLRNESSSSSNSSSPFHSDGIHGENGSDRGYPRQDSIWEDEDVPELTPDNSRRGTYTHKPSASTSSNSSTGSYAYPGWTSWSTPATPPPLWLSRPTDPKQHQPVVALQQKPLSLAPVPACPGCRIGGGPEEPVESDRSTPRDQHAGALRWPEELASGFCNACQLGGGLLPDYISRFTKELDEGDEDTPPVPPEEVARLMLLGDLGKDDQEERLHEEDGYRQDGEEMEVGGEGHKNEPEDIVRKEIVVRPSLLASKFHLGVTSESMIASRRHLHVGEAIARCESAPPPPTSSAEMSTAATSRVAEYLPLSDSEAGCSSRSTQEGHRPGNGDGDAPKPQPQQANSSKPRRGGKGGGRKKRPAHLSTQVAERSLARSNARWLTDTAENLADKIRSPLGEECWELDVLKEYEIKTPVDAPSLPPLEITKLPRPSWMDESPEKPAAATPRTKTYNHFRRQNGDF
jgi:hypothetical protein